MGSWAEHHFVCGLVNGLHARPASALADAACGFVSSMVIERESGETADVRSVLSVVGLDVQHGDRFVIRAEGEDASDAIAMLQELVEIGLEDGEDVTVEVGECRLPPVLRLLGVDHIKGIGVCGGAGMGAAVCVGGLALPDAAMTASARGINIELGDARRAVEIVAKKLSLRASASTDDTEASLLRAHARIAEDGALWAAIESRVRGGETAARAVVYAAEELAEKLRGVQSAYVRERAVDVVDIAMQLVDQLVPGAMAAACPVLEQDSVVFAEILTANQLLGMDRRHLRGLVLGGVGKTSHTVIIARGIGLPCVIDVAGASGIVRSGEQTVVDGDGGFAISPVDDRVRRFYERERHVRERKHERIRPLVRGRATTTDGQHLEVGVTTIDATEVAKSIKSGADGVGLFRTEFLYLEREAPPSEEEQREAYSAVLDAADGKPVILRTFDIGGDKPAPYLNLAKEDNPFLGVRGLRLYERRPELLRQQLRAMQAAASGRPTKVMAPMVATVREMAWFREQSEEFFGTAEIGMMVEVPSVALSLGRFAPHADFVSIGTNDLCQYWMAADRGNTGVSRLCDELQPEFLRLLVRIVTDAKAAGLWVGVCGEMGGRAANLPLMVGLGVDEVSAAPSEIAAIKLAVRDADSARCRQLVAAACDLDTADEVRELLDAFAWRANQAAPSIVEQSCIEVGVRAASKAEAIKAAVDLLGISGRTNRPRDVDEAVWERESAYSTGLGHGFAVPHCKCAAVRWPTLAVVRLAEPVDWEAMDGQPVGTVLLLAIPDGESAGGGGAAHLRIFATLARRLMHEAFRDRLRQSYDAASIESCLLDELDL